MSAVTPYNNSNIILFTPEQVEGCALWLDGADRSTLFQDTAGTNPVTASGQTVARWNDKSGNIGRNATAFGTPIYRNNSIDLSTGSYFNGLINISSGNLVTTAFCVLISPSSYSGARRILSLDDRSGNDFQAPSGFACGTFNASGRGDAFRNVGAATTTLIPTSTQVLCTTLYFSNGLFVFSFYGNYPNGSTLSYGTNTNTSNTNNLTRYNIGATNDGTSQLLGSFNEVIIYNRTLSQSQYQQVESYLAWKWNLQSSLPNNHPYKNAPYNAYRNLVIPRVNLTNSMTLLPNQISGLALWLDAADSSTLFQNTGGTNPVTATNQTVGLWKDKSGNGRDVTATGTPKYVNNAINITLNNYFTTPSMPISDGVTGSCTMFFVYNLLNYNTNNTTVFQNTISFSNFSIYIENASSRILRIAMSNVPTVPSPTPTIASNLVIYTLNLNNPVGYAFYITGSNNTSRSANTSVFNASLQYTIGSNSSNVNFYEILFYNSSLPTIKQQQIEGYLAWKWGLQSNLPSNHPAYIQPLPVPLPLTVKPYNFSPTQFSGCALWLDAADPNATGILPTNNTKISTWVDKSRNTNVTQGNSSFQPTFLSSEFNNLPTIRFTGVGGSSYQFLQTSATSIYNSITTMSIFGVMRVISTPPPYPSPFSIQNKISFYLRGLNNSNQFSGTNIWTYNGSTNVASSNTTFTYDTNTLFCLSLTNTQQFFLNGSNSIASPSFSFGSGTNRSIIIGWSGYNANDGYNGYISEILVYTTNLTINQRQQIEGYLAWKWGLQKSLPSSHPFYNYPPG